MNTFWNRPSAATPVQPTMELATSRFVDISHWLSSNKHVKIGFAIALPSVVLLLSTTPITDKLAQAWRRATGHTSPEKETARSECGEYDTDDKPPELPKKSYGQLPSGKRASRPERSDRGMNDNILFNNAAPESPKKSYAAAAASAQPLSPHTADNASINSASSSEHSRKHKFRLGENIKKRWQNRPFGHGSSESPLSP